MFELGPGAIGFLGEEVVYAMAKGVEQGGVHEARQHQISLLVEVAALGVGQHDLRVPPW